MSIEIHGKLIIAVLGISWLVCVVTQQYNIYSKTAIFILKKWKVSRKSSGIMYWGLAVAPATWYMKYIDKKTVWNEDRYGMQKGISKEFQNIVKRIAPNPFYTEEKGCLFLGDSIDVLKRIKDSSVDLIFADPPYSIKSRLGYV